MSFPINEIGVASGLLCGFLFGYILENAGFGSGCKLTAQFELRDWSVFKVMFPAILVAAFGLQILTSTGLLEADSVFVPTTYFWATLAGGALVGAGFAVGGYCPGTSAVGFASGRIDAFVFMIGLIAGTFLFAGLFPSLEGLMGAAAGPESQTLGQLLGVSNWVILIGLTAAAVGGFSLGKRMEARSKGPVTVEELFGDATPSPVITPNKSRTA